MRFFIFLSFYFLVSFFVSNVCWATGVSLNEVVWAGSSESANDEWLELYNPACTEVDLSGWSLVSCDGSPSIALTGIIKGESYYLLERSDDDSAIGASADQIYSGSLSNSGESLSLIDNNAVIIDSLDCSDGWLAGDSSNRLGMQKINNFWVDNCNSIGSPGGENVLCEESFDDEELAEEDEVLVENTETSEFIDEDAGDASEDSGYLEIINSPVVKKVELPLVVISEIMPNPLGVDSGEWIELHNQSKLRVDVSAWILRDNQGEYELADNTYLKAGGYLLLRRYETNLALNNDGDKLFLIRAKDGQVVSSVSFQVATEATSLILDEDSGSYLWTSCVSPGSENILEIPNRSPLADFYLPEKIETGELILFDASDSWDADGDSLVYSWKIGEFEKIGGVLVSHIFYTPGKYSIKLEVSDGEYSSNLIKQIVVFGEVVPVDSFDVGNAKLEITKSALELVAEKPDKLTISKAVMEKSPDTIYNLGGSKKIVQNNDMVRGVVTALPGTLGSQYFYIAGAKQAYQVYNYKKDFPELALGDQIEIYGEKSLINDETRIKTKSNGDMKVISSENEFVSLKIKSGEESDDLLGTLVQFQGDVVKKSGSDVYIDDGIGEFRVYLKQASGIKASVFNVADSILVTGILSKNKNGFMILPRAMEDISFLNSGKSGEVLGAYSSSSHWKLLEYKKSFSLKYFVVGGFSILLFVVILFFRRKKNSVDKFE